MKILSISVAAYNLEEQIEKNLNSFLNSFNKNKLEIIVTDDGSKDRTAEIVKKYADMYPDIVKLITQKNKGPGSSINNGVEKATGKYLKMVDGDDWVITENLDTIIDILEKTDVDMVLTNREIYNQKQKSIVRIDNLNLKEKEVLDFNEYANELSLNMHQTCFKTDILKKNKIIFDNCFYTDNEYLIFPIKHVKNFMYIDVDLYVYTVGQDNQSVSIENMKRNIKDYNFILNKMINFYEQNKELSKGKREFLCNEIAAMATNQLGTFLTYDDKKEAKNEIKYFNKKLKNKSLDIYNRYKVSKKAFFIVYSNYILTNFISNLYLKKIKNGRY